MGMGLRFRGPGRRSLGAKSQKVSKKSRKSLPRPPGPWVPKVRKKSRKRSEKVSKNSFSDFLETFRTFFETFFGLLGPRGRETFSRLFGDFLAFGPETPSPRSTESQAWGFPAERTKKCQAPIKLARPFPAPELRAEKLRTRGFCAF